MKHLTLYELNLQIRESLEEAFPGPVWVIAEISEMKVNRAGHCYLELVEKDEATDEIRARARAIIWSYSFRMLKSYFETTTGQPFSEGIRILAEAGVEFHPAYGISLNLRDIDPTYTVGDLALRRREVIRRLEEAGVLTMNQELSLPPVPQRIAVISSATAAGYQDFTNQLEKNPYGFSFYHRLYEATMQGQEAVFSILQALDRIYAAESCYDAVVIIRGGGAQADLSCFDHFDLAYAVAQFPLPVVTGIGHEKDETITDLVAHTRMKTPTAVAEFFISGMLRFRDTLVQLQDRLAGTTLALLGSYREQLRETATRMMFSSGKKLTFSREHLSRMGHQLKASFTRSLYGQKERLQYQQYRLARGTTVQLHQEQGALARLTGACLRNTRHYLQIWNYRLENQTEGTKTAVRNRLLLAQQRAGNHEAVIRLLDPQNVLKRGFTLTLQKGKILQSVHQISPDEKIESRFRDGSIFSNL